MVEEHETRLEIRPLTHADYPAVAEIQRACFPAISPWTEAQLVRLIERFPEGQIGIELDGRLVATSSALLVTGDDWEAPHVFNEVAGPSGTDGHEVEGDTL